VSTSTEASAPSVRRRAAGLVGIGAAACAACCVGPILGVLGGVGALSLGVGAALGLVAALVVLAVGIGAFVLWRRRRSPTCAAPTPKSVAVGDPVRR
jgi:hypothetical protein